MISSVPLTNTERDWLETINFHYFLGYARNLRQLRREGVVDVDPTIGTLRSLIADEEELAAFLTPWLRRAEWYLRTLTVKHFCSAPGHGEGYLDTSRWTSLRQGDRPQLQTKILDGIQRHGEPYVAKHLTEAASRMGLKSRPRFCPGSNEELWLELTKNLPLWAVVDSFSIGTLGKFIQMCGVAEGKESGVSLAVPVWKEISKELGISAKHFSVTVDAFGVLRNTVFHHQRLWLRPMAKSPGMPKDLQRRYREGEFKNQNKQAQFVVLVVLSRLLPGDLRAIYLQELEEFLEQRPLLKLGIMTSPFA
ncbi:hypothetical protein CPHO_11215 [Corynebacterium phocae]|uniref:CAAX protease n=2 Tax=Corynebacterium phocae TaxID=161895 RepID=A0A1L7D6N6_9CORY|nr:hypothetical protein CPHO_11215 [Corynebacterium phocae]